ncbi:hypothetical protein COJ85_01020 [Bacillus sp. AFS076308]|uniref:hypothetical protein n=1 Tax=Bacillus sp. AFS076308 TaxID=2033512 RepID=UPI000BF591B4|nr:hypothetical protein [Bacillus sp. AFS076308]PFO09740.1 hypothetical protein COJ85_01020 [Bacillus sp. AFS076308]
MVILQEEKQYQKLFLAGVVNGIGDRFSSVAVLGIGLTLSYSVANRLRKNFLVTGLVCLMLEGTFLLLLSRTHLVVFAFLLFCLVAFMSGIGNACFDTVLMKEIPEEHQGVMFGLLATIGNTILGLSMFLAGVALDFVVPRLLGLIGGGAYILIAIGILGVISSEAYRKKQLSQKKLLPIYN